MKLISSIRISSMAGLGPVAWDQDIQKMSMHPPLPEHIEYVEEKCLRNHNQHRIVQRHHADSDCDVTLVPMEIPLHYLLPLLAGKKYVRSTRADHRSASLSATEQMDQPDNVSQAELACVSE